MGRATGKGAADDGVLFVIGCCCLIVGGPILGVGIWMIIEGDSGGVVDLGVCCSSYTSSIAGPGCNEYVSAVTCPGWSDRQRDSVSGAEVKGYAVGEGIFRTDNSYIFSMQAPYGVHISGTVGLTAGGVTIVEANPFDLNSAVPDQETYCADYTNMDDANIARGWPGVATQVIATDVDVGELSDEIGDDPTFLVNVLVTAEDPLQTMVPNPLAMAVFPPQVFIDDDGLSTLSAWGVVLTVIGGLIVLPPVCVIAAACD